MESTLSAFTAYLKLRNMTPKTIEHRLGQLNRLDRWLGDTDLLEATEEQLESWQSSLKVCASSVQTYTSHVCRFYDWAHRYRHISSNPASRLEQPRIKPRMPRPIPEDHLRIALSAAPIGSDMHSWLCLSGYDGLRAGEIAAMDRNDFRRDQEGGGAFLTVHGKGGKERIIRIAPMVMDRIAHHLTHPGPMFLRPMGSPVTAHYVAHTAAVFLANLNLPYTLHTLRHRFATVMVDSGADIRDVQHAMGHASLTTTSIYLAYSERRGASSIDALASRLSAPAKAKSAPRTKKATTCQPISTTTEGHAT